MSFLHNISISIRLIIGFSLLSAVFLVMGVLGYRGMSQVSQNTDEIIQAAPLIDATMKMQTATRVHQLSLMAILDAASLEDMEKQWQASISAGERFTLYADAMLNGAETPSGQVFATQNSTLKEVVNETKVLHDTELLPRLEQLHKLLVQAFTEEIAARRVFIKFNSAYGMIEPEIAETHKDLIKLAATQLATGIESSSGNKVLLWPESLGDLQENLSESLSLILEMERTDDAGDQRSIVADFKRLTERTRAHISALEQGKNISGNELPSIEYPELQEKIEGWKKQFNERYAPQAERYAALLAGQVEINRKRLALNMEADQVADQVIEKLIQVEQAGRDLLNTTSSNSIVTAKGAIQSSFAMVAVGVLLSIVLGFLTTTSITRPLRQVVCRLKDIAAGEGDLTQRLDEGAKTELGELAHWFNTFVGKVQMLVSDVTKVSEHLTSAANQASAITERTNSGVQEQQAATSQVASAMEEMVTTVQEVARNTSDAFQATDKANDETRLGGEVVNRTVVRINDLADEVGQAAGTIEQLAQDSERVGGVLDVIRGIAEQTNLLALNAAIEAARAGEQGRGFAVVADEVRTLAGRTQQSTQEIQAMIERLQSRAKNAVDAMSRGQVVAGEGVSEAALAGESLESISHSVNSIRDVNAQVASAAEEQSAVAEEIKRNVGHIAAISEQTAVGAQETSDASEHLSRLSGELQVLVGGFRV